MILWLTGPRNVRKKDLANALRTELQNGRRYQILDAEAVKEWCHPDLPRDREGERIRAEVVCTVAIELARSGMGVIVSSITPFRSDRAIQRNRSWLEGVEFYEVWVTNRTYRVKEDPYEEPELPDAKIYTGTGFPREWARKLLVDLPI